METPPRKEDRIIVGYQHDAGLAKYLHELEESLAWYESVELTGYSVKKQGDGWLLVIRAKQRRRHVVAFFGDKSLLGCFRKLWLVSGGSGVDWRDDKYAR